MKNYVLATASALVLIMISGANAQEKMGENMPAAPMEMEGKEAPETGMKEAMPHEKAAPCPPKHHRKKHHRKHHKHHVHHARPTSMESNILVPVVQPCGCETPCETSPCQAETCETNACAPQYYQGRQENPYWYAGGYFWYPHASANMLPNYVPLRTQGMYWYPSRMHPHAVYVEGTNPVYAYPISMYAPSPIDARLYKRRAGR